MKDEDEASAIKVVFNKFEDEFTVTESNNSTIVIENNSASVFEENNSASVVG